MGSLIQLHVSPIVHALHQVGDEIACSSTQVRDDHRLVLVELVLQLCRIGLHGCLGLREVLDGRLARSPPLNDAAGGSVLHGLDLPLAPDSGDSEDDFDGHGLEGALSDALLDLGLGMSPDHVDVLADDLCRLESQLFDLLSGRLEFFRVAQVEREVFLRHNGKLEPLQNDRIAVGCLEAPSYELFLSVVDES